MGETHSIVIYLYHFLEHASGLRPIKSDVPLEARAPRSLHLRVPVTIYRDEP